MATMGTPSPSGTARSTAMHHHPIAREQLRCRVSVGRFDALRDEERHRRRERRQPLKAGTPFTRRVGIIIIIIIIPKSACECLRPTGRRKQNNRHKNSELNAIHDAVNDTKNAKDLRQSLHELSKHMASTEDLLSGGYHDEAKKAREKGGFGTFYREGG